MHDMIATVSLLEIVKKSIGIEKNSSGLKNTMYRAGLSLITVFLSQKLINSYTKDPVKRTFASLIEVGIVYFANQPTGKLKHIFAKVLGSIIRK